MFFSGFFPQLGFDETVELTKRLDEKASGNVDFYMTMSLSTALASLGLLQNSVPVVIGAMIVAPLMGPLVAAGLALVEADGQLFRKGVVVTCIGIVVGFCISLLCHYKLQTFNISVNIKLKTAFTLSIV